MVLVGLLLLALAFVVVGVVRSSVGWLIAALVVSLLAAGLLLRSYLQTRRRASAARAASSASDNASVPRPAAPAPANPPDPAGAAGSALAPGPQVWVVDGYPEYHVAGCGELAGLPAEAVAHGQAVEDGFQPCVVCNPDRALLAAAATSGGAADPADPGPATDSRHVLVVDGFPDYHAVGCRLLLGHEAVSILLEQAVEDGFSPCEHCDPDAARAWTETTPAEGGEVWVVDGFPDYHRAGCPSLAGLPAEAIPYEQAVEDGFAECLVCTPSNPAESGEVWVVDGFPDYHRADCDELSGLAAEAIPREQAVEDGFAPCPVCRPESPPSGDERADREVWVVDGHPDYHRSGCERLTGLPEQPIPYDQAVEDGFAPCPVCRPDEETGSPVQPGPESGDLRQ